MSWLLSKKFVVTLATSIFVCLAEQIGIDLNAEEVAGVVGSAAAYNIGQGIADNGKEKAKVEAAK